MIDKYFWAIAVYSVSVFKYFLSIPTHSNWYSYIQDFNHFVPVKKCTPIVIWLTGGQVNFRNCQPYPQPTWPFSHSSYGSGLNAF